MALNFKFKEKVETKIDSKIKEVEKLVKEFIEECSLSVVKKISFNIISKSESNDTKFLILEAMYGVADIPTSVHHTKSINLGSLKNQNEQIKIKKVVSRCIKLNTPSRIENSVDSRINELNYYASHFDIDISFLQELKYTNILTTKKEKIKKLLVNIKKIDKVNFILKDYMYRGTYNIKLYVKFPLTTEILTFPTLTLLYVDATNNEQLEKLQIDVEKEVEIWKSNLSNVTRFNFINKL